MNGGQTVTASVSLVHALADELILASKLLTELAFDLGTDDAVLRKHMASLQSIDHVTQLQLTIANALRHIQDEGFLIEHVTLDDVKDRIIGALRTGTALSMRNERASDC